MIKSTTDCRAIATVFDFRCAVASKGVPAFLIFCLFGQTPLLGEPQEDVQTAQRLLAPTQTTQQEPAHPPTQEEPIQSPEVLMQGPMHEAFAELHSVDPRPNATVEKKPPEPIEEIPPEFKPEGDNVQWIPGYWAWDIDTEDFVWISGVWRDVPPNQRWVAGYWTQVEGGYRWISGFWHSEGEEELEYLPPPPESVDLGPSTAPPTDDHFYIPGNWVYRHQQYQWRPGYWQPVIENWIWVPARYIWTPRGCIYRPGYWDRVIEQRGVCFAPVYFSTPVYRYDQYHYTPSCAIDIQFDFFANLFVDMRFGRYCYGDWYASHYREHHIYPWVNVHHYRHRHYDPYLAYYACPSRRHEGLNVYVWINKRHSHYVRHEHLRPRRTYAEQNRHAHLHRNRGADPVAQPGGAPAIIGVDFRELVNRSASGQGQNAPRRRFQKMDQAELVRARKQSLESLREIEKRRRQHEKGHGQGGPGHQGNVVKNRSNQPPISVMKLPGDKSQVKPSSVTGQSKDLPRIGSTRGNSRGISSGKSRGRELPGRRTGDAGGSQRKAGGSPGKSGGSATRQNTESLQRQMERRRAEQQQQRQLQRMRNQQRERKERMQPQNLTQQDLNRLRDQREREQRLLRQQQQDRERKERLEQQQRQRQAMIERARREQQRRNNEHLRQQHRQRQQQHRQNQPPRTADRTRQHSPPAQQARRQREMYEKVQREKVLREQRQRAQREQADHAKRERAMRQQQERLRQQREQQQHQRQAERQRQMERQRQADRQRQLERQRQERRQQAERQRQQQKKYRQQQQNQQRRQPQRGGGRGKHGKGGAP